MELHYSPHRIETTAEAPAKSAVEPLVRCLCGWAAELLPSGEIWTAKGWPWMYACTSPTCGRCACGVTPAAAGDKWTEFNS